jgi:hypothetical protein
MAKIDLQKPADHTVGFFVPRKMGASFLAAQFLA